MDLLRVDVRFQKSPQERPCPRSLGGPLARLGVDPRGELRERVVPRAGFPELVGNLSQKLLGWTTPVVLDVGQVGCGDVEISGESA